MASFLAIQTPVSIDLEKTYNPRTVEPEMYALWEHRGAFTSIPDESPHAKTFTIVIPPPNVTGALHLGHALNNTLQDILIRYHRMRGFNTLWQPGTDHAGIATQAVVERMIREREGKSRRELGREELVKRIWEWKEKYEERILGQLKLMGCSCDWNRTRFTLDEGMSRAVRHIFFKLFKDGLIFRGKRLVNWDTQLQTAVSDDEIYHETVKGHFWHFKYPVISDQGRDCQGLDGCRHEGMEARRHEGAKEGGHGGKEERTQTELEFVIIATTRPETMLGDTAVAVHPDPAGFLDREEKNLRDTLAAATPKDRAEIGAKLAAIAARRETHLPQLLKLRDMALAKRKLRLPLVEREIPLIADEWANPLLGSGCVKITPAHDPNDYEVGLRHNLPMINVLTPDGKIAPIIEPDPNMAPTKSGSPENMHSDCYAGLVFSGEGRARVVADLEARGLLEAKEDRDIDLAHSDRSKLPIEPFLSDQWFVHTKNLDETARQRRDPPGQFGPLTITMGDGAAAPGLAQAAIDAVLDRRIRVFPERYAKTYFDWLQEKRDWCISRQLWWGHRIPVWTTKNADAEPVAECDSWHFLPTGRDASDGTGEQARFWALDGELSLAEKTALIERGFVEDDNVLDTWFSSALWPFSTLGWPEETPHLKQYYPGSVLCTSRDIITNWVARMVMFGLYAMGRVPFDRVYIHPKILDGRGETMSKSKGNGVDPVDIIHIYGADALRYSMADMTTETQDIRMPVEYLCPHCGHLTDQGIAIKAEEQARKSRGEKLERKLQPADCHRVRCANKECGKEFATQWADAELKERIGLARDVSDRFEMGRNFCNKLWNAARFAFRNLEGAVCEPLDIGTLPPEDRWILARLSETIRRYHECLATYQFSASIKELREFFWDGLCDWYIELTKPRLSQPPIPGGADTPRQTDSTALIRSRHQESQNPRGLKPTARPDSAGQVLAFCLDQALRLWHPTIPFITERLWQQLNSIAPIRGLPPTVMLKTNTDLVQAAFPPEDGYPTLDDSDILNTFSQLQDATRAIRDLRLQCQVSPKDLVNVTVVIASQGLETFRAHAHIVRTMAGVNELHVDSEAQRPRNAAAAALHGLRVYVHDISDDDAERTRTRTSLADVEKQIAGKESKLNNEGFVARANPEIVSAERERLNDLLRRRTDLQTQLWELGTSSDTAGKDS